MWDLHRRDGGRVVDAASSATGVRVRGLPVTLEKLLAGLP